MRDGEPGDVRRIDDVAALAALANKDRVRVMDALAVNGPSTTSQLAAALGLASGSISHHVKVLVGVGLVQPAAARDARERRWSLVKRGMTFGPAQFRGRPAGEVATMAADGVMLEVQYEKAKEFVHQAVEPWDEAAYSGHVWLRVTPAELTEFGEELNDLLLRWRRREVPDDGEAGRHTALVFARAFPAEP